MGVCPCPGCGGREKWLEENRRKFNEWLIATGRIPAPEPPKELVPQRSSTTAYEMVDELRRKMDATTD